MANENKFNDPVFVRVDDTTTIKASVVEWGDAIEPGKVSVLIGNGRESVLISADDWKLLVRCVNVELDRVA